MSYYRYGDTGISNFKLIEQHLHGLFATGKADRVDVGEWHAMDVKGNPMAVSHELTNVMFQFEMPTTQAELEHLVEPNMPWAEAQFQERVCGVPLNPGQTYMMWPWQSEMDKHVKEVFSHTYMERYWPKEANASAYKYHDSVQDKGYPRGIRYDYGDLDDVVSLLERSPLTRQAVLPVWFPEDTGAVSHQRVPCSLFYHFILRDGKLHVTYSIRSCDFVRHFRDDVYHTVRLAQWVLDQLQERSDEWDGVEVGTLTMQITSLHVFEGDLAKLRRTYDLRAA